MSRPRSFSLPAVVETAKQLFWSRGYGGTALGDIEKATGLSRSSLYQAFGSKEALFTQALDEYVATFMGPLLAPMEAETATHADVADFFAHLVTRFCGDPEEARKGCLWVNSLAEFSGREHPLEVHANAYRLRLYDAFSNALTGGPNKLRGPDRLVAEQRARMLVATTFGLWLAVRIDPEEAATLCDAVRAEVQHW